MQEMAAYVSLNPGLGRSPGGAMATHPSILVYRISWIEEPGGLQSMGHRVGHDWAINIHTHTPYPLVALNQVEQTGMEAHGGLRVLLEAGPRWYKVPSTVLEGRMVLVKEDPWGQGTELGHEK